MNPTLTVDNKRLLQVLDAVGPNVSKSLEDTLGRLGTEIAADAKTRASAHIRFLGKNPGVYVKSIYGGLAKKKSSTRTTGFVRSSSPLAHLMELGFTIRDWAILPGTGKNTDSQAGAVMAFEGDAKTIFARAVHRHETVVPAYPAIFPAYEARRAEILAAFDLAKRAAGKVS